LVGRGLHREKLPEAELAHAIFQTSRGNSFSRERRAFLGGVLSALPSYSKPKAKSVTYSKKARAISTT
jgi:hypothetical protein